MRETLWLFLHLETMKTLLLRLWRIWFYLLAGIPVPFLFPFLAIALLFPKGYTVVFWVARTIWAPIILGGSGFYTKIRYANPYRRAPHIFSRKPYQLHRSFCNASGFKIRLSLWEKELVKIPSTRVPHKRAVVIVR